MMLLLPPFAEPLSFFEETGENGEGFSFGYVKHTQQQRAVN